MNIRSVLACLVLAIALTLAISFNVLAGESVVNEEAGYINARNVRLRSEGSLNAGIITTMRYRARVTVLRNEGEWYQVIHNGSNGYVFNEFVTLGEPDYVEINSNIELLDWSGGGKSLMKSGTIVTVTDVSTGIQYKIRVMSSGSHSDVEPLTADDTARKRQTRGGSWSWSPRAIWLTFENGRTIAASANGMPHGGSSISGNNFSGHFCIHLLNSRNHFNNRVDTGHQNQVRRAYNA